jgi:hypothetical protein
MGNRILATWGKLSHSGPGSLEIFMAYFSFVWAVIVLSQTVAYTNFHRILSDIMPVQIWSLVLLSLGIVQLGALAGGRHKRRRLAAYLGVFFWGGMAGTFFIFGLVVTQVSVVAALTSAMQWLSMIIGDMLIVLSLTLLWPEK